MRFSRLYERTAEFRRRCLAFDFAVVAHAVVDAALAVRKTLGTWWKGVRPVVSVRVRVPVQLLLGLEDMTHVRFSDH